VIFGIDSQVLIYAEMVPLKPGPKSADYADLQERAKLLIYKAADQGDIIVIPAMAISELLVPVPLGQHGAIIQVLEKNFQCPPLDLPAASIAADLWARFRSVSKSQPAIATRNVLRSDAFIVASARAANATHFFSHDKQCRTLAELAGMKASDLPAPTTLDEKYLLSDIRSNSVPEIRPAQKKKGKKFKGRRRDS
jgi:hypothetical protein